MVLADNLMYQAIPATNNQLCIDCGAVDKRGFKALDATAGAGPQTRAKFRQFVMEQDKFANLHAAMGVNVRYLMTWIHENRANGMVQIKRPKAKADPGPCIEMTGQLFSVITRIFVKFAADCTTLAEAEANYHAAISTAM